MNNTDNGQKQSFLYKLLGSPHVYRISQRAFGRRKGDRLFLHEFLLLKEGDSVLDIGCGTADIVDLFNVNVNYVGFDFNNRYIKYAEKKYKEKVTLFCKNVNESDVQSLGKFDFVISMAVVHHLNDEDAIKLYKLGMQLLKPGGTMITSDPTINSSDSAIGKWLTRHDRGEYIRIPNDYEKLAKTVFPNVNHIYRNDFLFITQSCCIIVCKKPIDI